MHHDIDARPLEADYPLTDVAVGSGRADRPLRYQRPRNLRQALYAGVATAALLGGAAFVEHGTAFRMMLIFVGTLAGLWALHHLKGDGFAQTGPWVVPSDAAATAFEDWAEEALGVRWCNPHDVAFAALNTAPDRLVSVQAWDEDFDVIWVWLRPTGSLVAVRRPVTPVYR